MPKLVFRVGKNTFQSRVVDENNADNRRAFVRHVYTFISNRILTASDNLADDKLSQDAQDSFNMMKGMYESRLNYLERNGRQFIENGVISREPNSHYHLEII